MKNIISKIPAPIAGLGLGLASLGTIIGKFNPSLGLTFTVFAIIVLAIFLIKVIFHPKAFMQDLKHPVFSSIIPTFSMGMMIVGSFSAKFNFTFGKSIWLMALVIHILFFINFITVIFKNKNFSHIVPSYFIPSVGIVVACVSGKVFNMQNLCNAIFFFGFFSYMVTLLLVIVRLAKEELPKPKQSTLAIMAAPASLCLAGLLTITKTPNPILLYILVPLAFAMTIYVYYKMFHLLKIPFNPGYSAYTFPLVISAIATLKLAGYMKSITFSFAPFVKQFGIVQLLIATALVAYVALRYLHFYLIPTKK